MQKHAELGVDIGFGQWMAAMVPFVIVVMAISWFLLTRLYPFSQRNVSIKIEGKFRKDAKAIIVYVTFAVTVTLWVLDRYTGINSNAVAMIPLAVFAVTGILGKEELKSINWDVLWLVAGGFALGVGLQESGLAKSLVASIPFGTWPPVLVIAGSGLVCYLMSTFMSHTASTALLVPILATVATGMKDVLADYGGAETMLIGVAICASLYIVTRKGNHGCSSVWPYAHLWPWRCPSPHPLTPWPTPPAPSSRQRWPRPASSSASWASPSATPSLSAQSRAVSSKKSTDDAQPWWRTGHMRFLNKFSSRCDNISHNGLLLSSQITQQH